ncbi:carbamoyltransferase HypF [Sansalvadorimonas verongulae]|nr:carbamoyltransferase HypF [Sansalvadorimonas verongulae]
MQVCKVIINRLAVRVWGTVQGVGFRPTIYRLAKELQLTGVINNNGEGVYIEVQGEQALSFVDTMHREAPPLSRIERVDTQELPVVQGEQVFVIVASEHSTLTSISISPDKGVCPDCLAEMSQPGNRHYRYPFTNCTHCGPRYTLVKQLPYDRPFTSMSAFPMCPDCEKAYNDPEDRRYHAQPVSCNVCGPQIRLQTFEDVTLADRYDGVVQAAAAIHTGKIVAVKGIGGYHLFCDATNSDAVARLRNGKHRPKKPLAVMMTHLEQVQAYTAGTEQEYGLLSSQERPIVLLSKSGEELAENVAPDVNCLGVMLPYTPLHVLLLELLDVPVVATSANLSGQPILTAYEQVRAQLSNVADLILDHNRPIVHPCDDSLVQIVGGRRQTLRLSRGYAPLILPLESRVEKNVLALGAQQKTSLAFATGKQAVINPFIGDLNSLDMQERYEANLESDSGLYQFKPGMVVGDQHPAYETTLLAQSEAEEHDLSLCQVQHHHAHILSVMAEHGRTNTVLGFAFDGTGFGDEDNSEEHIWGGEVLLADVEQAQRLYHLKPFRLIGGERAIKEPRRILLGLLLEYFSLDDIQEFQLPAFRTWAPMVFNNLYRLWQNPSVSPLTSSIGRLIDAWASLLDLVQETAFEGECGMALERVAHGQGCEYRLQVSENGLMDCSAMLAQVLDDLHCKPVSSVATGLLTSVATLVMDIARCHPEFPVAVSGGVFQNRFIMERLINQFHAAGRELLTSESIPPNDGGIAAGQLWYGIHSILQNR